MPFQSVAGSAGPATAKMAGCTRFPDGESCPGEQGLSAHEDPALLPGGWDEATKDQESEVFSPTRTWDLVGSDHPFFNSAARFTK